MVATRNQDYGDSWATHVTPTSIGSHPVTLSEPPSPELPSQHTQHRARDQPQSTVINPLFEQQGDPPSSPTSSPFQPLGSPTTSSCPGWLRTVTDRIANLTLTPTHAHPPTTMASVLSQPSTASISKPAALTMRNLVAQPSNPTPSNPNDYYLVHLPGRTIQVLKQPFWVPSGPLYGLQYRSLKAAHQDAEEIFALAMIKHMRDGMSGIAALGTALYETRDWADRSLPKERARAVSWGIFYVLDDLVAHLRDYETADLQELAEQVPPLKGRLESAGLIPLPHALPQAHSVSSGAFSQSPPPSPLAFSFPPPPPHTESSQSFTFPRAALTSTPALAPPFLQPFAPRTQVLFHGPSWSQPLAATSPNRAPYTNWATQQLPQRNHQPLAPPTFVPGPTVAPSSIATIAPPLSQQPAQRAGLGYTNAYSGNPFAAPATLPQAQLSGQAYNPDFTNPFGTPAQPRPDPHSQLPPRGNVQVGRRPSSPSSSSVLSRSTAPHARRQAPRRSTPSSRFPQSRRRSSPPSPAPSSDNSGSSPPLMDPEAPVDAPIASPAMYVGKPPTFSGDDNIVGFIRDFEEWCKAKRVSGIAQVVNLKTTLRDEAKTFVQNLQLPDGSSYEHIKQILLETYGQAGERYFYALKDLRRGNRTLEDYNSEFQKLRSKCQQYLTPLQEIDFYLEGQPQALKLALKTHGPSTLQRAMQKAQELDKLIHAAQFARPVAVNAEKTKCDQCGRWHLRSAACKPEDVASWKRIKASGSFPAPRQPNQARPARFVKLVELEADEQDPPADVVQAAATSDPGAEMLAAEDTPYLLDFQVGKAE